ncbi:MAG: VanZ family protein, partial [Lentisphaerota bacterium]
MTLAIIAAGQPGWNSDQQYSSPSAAQTRRRWAVLAWGVLLAYAAFIDLTLSTVPAWREALIQRFGESVFDKITYGAAIALLSGILAVMIFRNREKQLLPYLSLIAILLFLRHVLRHWITIPVEQIHFIEYGLMGFFAYNALRFHLRGWLLVIAALLLTYFFGMVDECIQGNLANRVGEQRDMYWNGLAGLMGLSLVVLALKPKWIRGASGHREVIALLLIVAVCLPLQGYFNA